MVQDYTEDLLKHSATLQELSSKYATERMKFGQLESDMMIVLAGMIKEYQRIKKKIGGSAKVIGTGGNIKLMAKYCKSLDKIDPDLTLKGLNLIFRHYEGKKHRSNLSLADNGKIG